MPRASYRIAGEAMRSSLARAVEVKEELRRADWRILCACIVLVGSYSRHEDHVSLQQVADAAGLSRWRASGSLNRLAKLRVISWKPSKRRGSASSLLGIGEDISF